MKKSILLLVPVLVLSGCNSGDKAKTVIEYLKDPKAMVADNGYCFANPAERDTTKCHAAGRAYGLAINSFTSFFKCLEPKKGSTAEFRSNPACIDRVAKEEHMLP